jgi:hypothetical protein
VGVEVIVTVGLEVGVVVAWVTATSAPGTAKPLNWTICPFAVPLAFVALKL